MTQLVTSVNCPNWRTPNYCTVAKLTCSPGVCADCLAKGHEGKHLIMPESQKVTQKLAMHRPPCNMLGKILPDVMDVCATCSNELAVQVHFCRIHSQCTISQQGKRGFMCCAACPNYHEQHGQ